jgi:hypothetical protein
MKTDNLLHTGFTEVNTDAMTRLGGGEGFAYEVGKTLRFLGIHAAYGLFTGGIVVAIADAAYIHVINNQ